MGYKTATDKAQAGHKYITNQDTDKAQAGCECIANPSHREGARWPDKVAQITEAQRRRQRLHFLAQGIACYNKLYQRQRECQFFAVQSNALRCEYKHLRGAQFEAFIALFGIAARRTAAAV